MHPLARLTDEQVREIQKRKGSARSLALEFKVSHTTILKIRRGEREPDASDRYTPREKHLTPIGKVVSARLVRPTDFTKSHKGEGLRGKTFTRYTERQKRFTISIELSEADAIPLIERVNAAVEERIARENDDENSNEYEGVDDSGYRPYRKLPGGKVRFDFRSKPGVTVITSRGVRTGHTHASILLTNSAGNRLRKPERIKNGSLVRVSYELFTWVYCGPSESEDDAFMSDHHVGVGITLSLRGVELVKA